jgi:hypothetical protein
MVPTVLESHNSESIELFASGMLEEKIKEVLHIYLEQTGTINVLWNIFLVASLAMLGYVYKDRTLMNDWKIKAGLSIGFPLFAIANSCAMSRSQTILVAASEYLKNLPSTEDQSFGRVLGAHGAITVVQMHMAHVVFTLLVLVAMWLPNIANAFLTKKNKRRKAA